MSSILWRRRIFSSPGSFFIRYCLSAAVEIFPVDAKEMFPVLLLSVRKPEQSLKRAEHPVQVKRTGEIQPEVHIIEFIMAI